VILNAIAATCLTFFVSAPAKLSVRAEISSTHIEAGEPFSYEVTVTVDGQGEDPQYTPPELENIEIIRKGTQHGQSFVMNFGSAPKVQVSTTYTYVMQATRPGRARIGPASAKIGHDLQATEAVLLDVGAGGGGNAAQQPAQPQSRTPSLPNATTGGKVDPVMLRIVPDKFEASVGEQVVLSVFLLSRVELSDIQSITQPQLEGVLLERDDRPRTNLQPRIQRFNGQEYQVFEIQRYALFPLREGKVTIGAFSLEAQGGMGFFAQGRSYRVSSDPVDITAKALPSAKRPVGFSPMNVGQLEFRAQLLPGQAQVGKPLTLRMTVSGVGNLPKVSLPSPRFGGKLKAYDPETKSEQRFDQGQLVGKIQRDYLFVPTEPGEHIIAPLVFYSFDPKTGEYREQASQAFAINASGEASAAGTQMPTAAPITVDAKSDLHAIRPSSALKDDRPGQVVWTLVWAGTGSSVLSALSLVLLRIRRRERSPQDIARAARHKADRELRQALSKEPVEAYAEMHRVVRQYLLERFGISLGTGRDRLRAALLDMNAQAKQVDTLLVELDNCDFARFAPGGHLAKEAAMSKDRLQDVIAELDLTKGGLL
jgi:BatD DUF11 like domain